MRAPRDDRWQLVQQGSAEPELSVLVPLYRQQRHVGEALRSVLSQRDVVLDIVVSDDCSPDRTWARAAEVLGSARVPHRIRLRSGAVRRRRDHVASLEAVAHCDPVLLAHGDDIAEPTRARRVLDVFADPSVSVVGSAFTRIDGRGRLIGTGPSAGSGPGMHELGAEDLVGHDPRFAGAMLAWRRSALAPFGPLDSDAAACGHDIVLPFRGALAGTAVAIDEPLVRWRRHRAQWSARLASRDAASRHVALALYKASAARVQRRDLDRAQELGLVEPARAAVLRRQLEGRADRLGDEVLDGHDELVRLGRAPAFLTPVELALVDPAVTIRRAMEHLSRRRSQRR